METLREVFDALLRRDWYIENRQCVNCHGPALSFTDKISRQEYSISGICQNCQDEIFKEIEEDLDIR